MLDQPRSVPAPRIVAADRTQPHRQSNGAEMATHALGVGRRAEAQPRGEIEGHGHAGADRLAMQQLRTEAGFRFQRMAERMAEVEESAQIGRLAFVGGHDAGLRKAALLDGIGPCRGIAAEHRRAVGLAPIPERRIVDQPVLGHFGIARQQLATRQAVEHRGIGQHEARLIEGADKVLAVARVDAGLAADRRVDLGQEGRRYLDEIDATQQHRGGKAREIADHAAAQSDQGRLAIRPMVEQLVHQPGKARELLAALACRHGDRRGLDAGLVEGSGEAGTVERGDGFVAHDGDARGGQQRARQVAGAVDQAGADRDIVAAAGEIDPDRAGGAHLSTPAD